MKYILLILIYILLLFYYVRKVGAVHLRPVENVFEDTNGQMNGVVYKTINKYNCSTKNISGINLILYGTNAWTFPVQDVNLTLRYPTINSDADVYDEKYLVTGFQVILHIDGPGSQGFITEGGILQDSITLTFTSRKISRLQYQFWVYGIPKDWEPSAELNNVHDTLNCVDNHHTK